MKGWENKLVVGAVFVACIVVSAGQVYAGESEIVIGKWRSKPSGDISVVVPKFTDALAFHLSADSDKIYGRIKMKLPGWLPGVSGMLTPLEIRGLDYVPARFQLNGHTYTSDMPVYSRAKLKHYDAAIYQELPLLRSATNDILSVDFGINVRATKYEVSVFGTGVDLKIKSEDDGVVVVPMLYGSAKIKANDHFDLSGEFRAFAAGGNSNIDVIGRARLSVGHCFVAGGWRHETLKVRIGKFRTSSTISGTFVETGVRF